MLVHATCSGLPSPRNHRHAGYAGDSLTHYWLYGGTSRPNQGQLEMAEVGDEYHRAILGEKTDNYVPWLALQHHGKRDDGYFVALDYVGTWTFSLDRAQGRAVLSSSLPGLANFELGPGKPMELPLVTLGVFHESLDDMGSRVFDWQYEYLWDYTNSDYFARCKWGTRWFYCSRNLQEQFTARLAWLDMDAYFMRTAGFEILWDDAGWSMYPGWPVPDNYGTVFRPSYEGPDYAETLRYLRKMDMQWIVWIAGRPSLGLLNTKVGSWGDFQWRADGVGLFGVGGWKKWADVIECFLSTNPSCSAHTCDGGSRYAHQFEMQRLADVNYLSDMGRGDQENHYFSYLEVPDKWLDGLELVKTYPTCNFNPETGYVIISMSPMWGIGKDEPGLSRMLEIYRYLREQGVAGAAIEHAHPIVTGDTDYWTTSALATTERSRVSSSNIKPLAR